MPDDRFGKTIIMLNKDKIKPSANAKFDNFLRETVTLNILLLYRTREVLLQAARATSHGSHHATVKKYADVSLLVKYFMKSRVFKETLGRGSKENQLPDLFSEKSTVIFSGDALANYQRAARGNWKNYDKSILDETLLESTNQAAEDGEKEEEREKGGKKREKGSSMN